MNKLRAFVLTVCFSIPFSLFTLFPVGSWLHFLGPAVAGPRVLFQISIWLSLVFFVNYFVSRVVYYLLAGKPIYWENYMLVLILLGLGFSLSLSLSNWYWWSGLSTLFSAIVVGLILCSSVLTRKRNINRNQDD